MITTANPDPNPHKARCCLTVTHCLEFFIDSILESFVGSILVFLRTALFIRDVMFTTLQPQVDAEPAIKEPRSPIFATQAPVHPSAAFALFLKIVVRSSSYPSEAPPA